MCYLKHSQTRPSGTIVEILLSLTKSHIYLECQEGLLFHLGYSMLYHNSIFHHFVTGNSCYITLSPEEEKGFQWSHFHSCRSIR